MTSLWLPAPTRTGPSSSPKASGGVAPRNNSSSVRARASVLSAPSYEDRCRAASELAANKKINNASNSKDNASATSLFVPRSLKDFDDGGAFPEIHIAQYPRHMGNPHLKKKRPAGAAAGVARGAQSSSSLALISAQVDEAGEVSYDAVVTGGTNADKQVFSKHADLRGSKPQAEDLELPTEEEERAVAERTASALQALVNTKVAMLKPTGSAMTQAATSANQEQKTQFIKYTPREDAPGYNPAAKQRVIQMVPAQLDPMAPPKHMHKKAPRGPAEDPVPILHAPPEKLTKEERAAWNVPACISNWKNTKGYTIPLDKRLAADGRGLRDDTTINSNFATLSESLYVAERQAREEVRMRAQVQKRLAISETERREQELRELANKARLERSRVLSSTHPITSSTSSATSATLPPQDGDTDNDEGPVVPSGKEPSGMAQEEVVAAQQRERLRMARKREREKELRMEKRGSHENEDDVKKKQRLESERDVSEKIALGVHTGTGTLGGEVDTRLYNQTAGMDSGFGAEDEYNTYSKPLFDRDASVTSSSIYRPTRGAAAEDADEQYQKLLKGGTSKFQPDQGFAGADGGSSGGGGGGARSAPVQFEKDSSKK